MSPPPENEEEEEENQSERSSAVSSPSPHIAPGMLKNKKTATFHHIICPENEEEALLSRERLIIG